MIRLGVAARTLGDHNLRGQASKARPGAEAAHVSRGLLHVRDTLIYLQRQQIGCFRLPSTILPLGAGIEPATCAAALEETAELCAEVGTLARSGRVRLSVHPGLQLNLATPDELVAQRALHEIGLYAALLDALGCGPEAVVVLHVGGAYGEPVRAMERFAMRYERLPGFVRRRIAVEADEDCFDITQLLWLRRCCGIPLIFDSLHFQLNNPRRLPAAEAIEFALASWPPGIRPKIHFSSQRTEAHLREAKGGAARVVAPRRGQHADFINPFEFA